MLFRSRNEGSIYAFLFSRLCRKPTRLSYSSFSSFLMTSYWTNYSFFSFSIAACCIRWCGIVDSLAMAAARCSDVFGIDLPRPVEVIYYSAPDGLSGVFEPPVTLKLPLWKLSPCAACISICFF